MAQSFPIRDQLSPRMSRFGAMIGSMYVQRPASGRKLRTAADAHRLFRRGFGAHVGRRLQVAHLDRNGRVLAIESHPLRRIGGMMVMPIRALLERSLRLDARALVIAHDHGAAEPQPSRADMVATRALVDAARTLDIEVTDHLVFGGPHCTSFRALGLL